VQNLAYNIDILPDAPTRDSTTSQPPEDACAACGEPLFGPDAGSCSWQAWGSFWEIMGMSTVELVCGACGEYLQEFFRDERA
jgi:hypothetical protein